MAPTYSAGEIRAALAPLKGALPQEIWELIESYIPALQTVQQLARERARRANGVVVRSTPSLSDHMNPRIAPKNGSCPFLRKLPIEIRRTIFVNYLLPSKKKSIQPVQYEKRHEAFRRAEKLRENASRRARNNAQQNLQNGLFGNAHWNHQLNQPLPAAQLQAPFVQFQPPPPPPPQPLLGAMQHVGQAPGPPGLGAFPPLPGAGQAPLGQNGPPTGNPLNFNGNPLLNAPPPAPPQPQLPWGQIAGPLAVHNHPFNNNLFGGPFIPPVQPALQINHFGLHNSSQFRRQQTNDALRNMVKYDDTPERMVLSLLLTNTQLCFEVSKILYEEFTYQIHIHLDGVELLGFDRIPTLENWGVDIEQTMGAFKSEKQFCFQRMKHLEFVYFGGDPRDRLAGLRMRESTSKLVSFLKSERQPVLSIKVRFEYEKKIESQPAGVINAIYDDTGNFWTTAQKHKREHYQEKYWRDPRQSIMYNVPNVQLVWTPLKRLNGVSNVEVQYPDGIGGNKELSEATKDLKALMKTNFVSNEDLAEIMREEMLMDARRDKELKQAGAGGYYKQEPKFIGIDDAISVSTPGRGLLAGEEDMEEDGLTEAFGGEDALQESADYMIVEMDEDEGFDFSASEDDTDQGALPATMPSAGSFNFGQENDVEFSNVLSTMAGTSSHGTPSTSPSRKRKKNVDVEEPESLFGMGFSFD